MSKTARIATIIVLVAVMALSFGTGYNLSTIQHQPRSGAGLSIVDEAWNVIFRDYVEKDRLDPRKLSQAAIKGLVQELDDPYTSYLNTEDYQIGLTSLEGEFDGIGAHVSIKDEQLTVIAPIPGSPADKAGIRAGDVILEIDGKATAGLGLAEAVLSIRGTQGTPVKLLILHQNEAEPVEIEVIRDKIDLPSVESEMKGDIAYIRITQFSDGTDEELSPALNDAIANGATGIILDLRYNPGGLLDVVVAVASHFLRQGVVVNVVSNQQNIASLSVQDADPVTDLPMVVLVNSYSASGSEVLSGALQDYARAAVAGNTTYGKGSVNVLRQLSDGSGLYITTARWSTPEGRLIEGKGIDPDYILELEGDDAINWAIDYLKKK